MTHFICIYCINSLFLFWLTRIIINNIISCTVIITCPTINLNKTKTCMNHFLYIIHNFVYLNKCTFSSVRHMVITRLIAAPKELKSCSMPKNGSKSISNKLCCCMLAPILLDGPCCVDPVFESAILLKTKTK